MTNEPYRLRLGQAIRARRKEIGVPASEIAKRLGVHIQYVYQIERGDSPVPIDRLPAIAAILKTTVGEMFQTVDSIEI